MIKRFFVLAVLVVLSGCGSKSMLKLAGAIESSNKDLVKANQALAKSNLDLSNSVAKETERKAKKDDEKKANEEAKKNRPWYVKLID